MTSLSNKQHPCPCGTGKAYLICCDSFISNQQLPSTPEELMRSRYTAYTLNNFDYIIQTMRSPAADHFNIEEAIDLAKNTKWINLEIINTSHNTQSGIVEFIAHYDFNNNKQALHEISEFKFENGKWYYVNGIHPNKIPTPVVEKIGRNEPCPCGSNKKYKKCCGT